MDFERFLSKLNLETCPEILRKSFAEAKKEFDENGCFFLASEYIRGIHEKCNSFSKSLEVVVSAAEEISKNEILSLYALLVFRAMTNDRKVFLENLKQITFPQGEGAEFLFLPFVILIPTIDALHDHLIERDIPMEIVHATVQQYEECVYIYSERFDKLGFNKRYFDWLQGYVDKRYLNIGRLRFEMANFRDCVRFYKHKDSGDIKVLMDSGEFNSKGLLSGTPPIIPREKYTPAVFEENGSSVIGYEVIDGKITKNLSHLNDEWLCVLKKGDQILKIHIPANGAFTKDVIHESYAYAKQIFSKYYKDFDFKAFVCHSWMMSMELKDILKPTSNLIGFQNDYVRYPIHAKGEDVFNFVFKLKFTTYEDMPEDTSLQRAIKQRYLSGEYVYEYGGAFLADDI